MGKGGGGTGERILFSLESRFLLRVRIRRRKEEENAPIRNERRMFLPSLVSHSLPRIDAQGTHHRLPKKKTVGNATTRVLPCFPEKKTWRNESPDLLSLLQEETDYQSPASFRSLFETVPPPGKKSRKKVCTFPLHFLSFPLSFRLLFQSQNRNRSRTGEKRRKKTFCFPRPVLPPHA